MQKKLNERFVSVSPLYSGIHILDADVVEDLQKIVVYLNHIRRYQSIV